MGTETAGEGLLKTPLYDTHVTYKGKIVPFAGYLLPVQYETGVSRNTWQCVPNAVFLTCHTWGK